MATDIALYILFSKYSGVVNVLELKYILEKVLSPSRLSDSC